VECAEQRSAKKQKQADTHFYNVTRAAGRKHTSLEDQIEHIESLSKAAAVSVQIPKARTASSAEVKLNNEHLSRIDCMLGLEKYKSVTRDAREGAVQRMADSTKPVTLTPKIKKKLRIALSDDHLRDASDLASTQAARDRLGF
jgi:CRISPR/Cas system-associated endonuclease Cas3-HD